MRKVLDVIWGRWEPQQYILGDPYRNMGDAVGIFATPEKFSALPISVLEL
jgi:hypothetical protein